MSECESYLTLTFPILTANRSPQHRPLIASCASRCTTRRTTFSRFGTEILWVRTLLQDKPKWRRKKRAVDAEVIHDLYYVAIQSGWISFVREFNTEAYKFYPQQLIGGNTAKNRSNEWSIRGKENTSISKHVCRGIRKSFVNHSFGVFSCSQVKAGSREE